MNKLLLAMGLAMLYVTSAPAQSLVVPNCVVDPYGYGVYHLKCANIAAALSRLRMEYPEASVHFAPVSSCELPAEKLAGGFVVMINPPLKEETN